MGGYLATVPVSDFFSRLRPKERSDADCRGRPITRDPIEVDSASILESENGARAYPGTVAAASLRR